MRTAAFLFLFCFIFGMVCFASTQQEDFQEALKYFQSDQYNQAIDTLQKCLGKDPNQAQVYNLLGLIYLKQGQSIESAIGSFEQAIRIEPKYADAYFNLASTYAGPANRPQLAAATFKKTLEVDPNYAKAHFGLGWFSLTANQDAETAAAQFQKAIDYFPDFAEAYYGLGLSYVQMGKAPLALKIVSQLRMMGREDLAAYMETAVRGGNLSDKFKAENEAPPPKEESPSSAVVAGTNSSGNSAPGGQSSDFLSDLSQLKTDSHAKDRRDTFF